MEQNILLDLFPRAQIDICLQVLQADGGILCACINAAMLAVADAGVLPFETSCSWILFHRQHVQPKIRYHNGTG
jgi:exosome complex component RRP41